MFNSERYGSVVEQWSCNLDVMVSKPIWWASALWWGINTHYQVLQRRPKAISPLVAWLKACTCFLSSPWGPDVFWYLSTDHSYMKGSILAGILDTWTPQFFFFFTLAYSEHSSKIVCVEPCCMPRICWLKTCMYWASFTLTSNLNGTKFKTTI